MIFVILAFLAALVVAITATPVIRRVALNTGIVAVPSKTRFHQRSTPLLGGVAIYVAFSVALIAFGSRFFVPQLISIFVGATFVSFLGLWDDRRALSPIVKLVGQIIAAGLLVLTGIRVEIIPNELLDIALTEVWIVGITNAMNLVDNMDGLSGGIASVASAFFLVLSVQNGQFLVASLAAAVLGHVWGFSITTSIPLPSSWEIAEACFSAICWLPWESSYVSLTPMLSRG